MLQLSLQRVELSREKRGTVVDAIIGAIVTIGSHYRGIMCSAARNSAKAAFQRFRAPVPSTRRTENRPSLFDRLSPPYYILPFSLPPRPSLRSLLDEKFRLRVVRFSSVAGDRQKVTAYQLSRRRLGRFYRLPLWLPS